VTLDEVIAAGLKLTVQCQETACRAETSVDPVFFAGRRRGSATMKQLAVGVHCMACGSAKIALGVSPKS
jgi:hypothetical protein